MLLCPHILNHSMKQIVINHFHIHGDYIAGDGIDIHHNPFSTFCQGKRLPLITPQASETSVEDVTQVISVENDIPLFKYIHPSITIDEEKRKVHCEVQNLVRQFSMTDICRYLRRMSKDNRVYLNVKPEAMFAELHRMGLPPESTPGFSYKNFMNYFNISDQKIQIF